MIIVVAKASLHVLPFPHSLPVLKGDAKILLALDRLESTPTAADQTQRNSMQSPFTTIEYQYRSAAKSRIAATL
jgi:hypothetical protein